MISSIYKYCAKRTNANHYDQLVDWTVNLLVHLLLDTTHFVGTLQYHPNFKHSNSSHLLQCCVSQCVVQGNIQSYSSSTPPPPLWKFQVRGGMDTVWNCTTLLTNLANLRGQGDEICSHKILLNVHV